MLKFLQGATGRWLALTPVVPTAIALAVGHFSLLAAAIILIGAVAWGSGWLWIQKRLESPVIDSMGFVVAAGDYLVSTFAVAVLIPDLAPACVLFAVPLTLAQGMKGAASSDWEPGQGLLADLWRTDSVSVVVNGKAVLTGPLNGLGADSIAPLRIAVFVADQGQPRKMSIPDGVAWEWDSVERCWRSGETAIYPTFI